MRATVITNPTPPHNTSPSISLGKFVKVLRYAGEDVRIFGARLRLEEAGLSPDIPIKSFRYGGKGVIKLISFLLLQVKMFFTLIFSLRKWDNVYFWIGDKMMGAYLAALLRGCEINYFVYGRVQDRKNQGISEKLIRFFVRHADYVCAEAPSVFDLWDMIPDKKPLRVIPLPAIQNDDRPLPFDERDHRIISVGRLSPEKSPVEIIRAMAILHSEFPEYSLMMVGAGALEDECRTAVSELGAEDFITLTGWLSHDEVIQHLSRSRLLVHPSVTEGVPGGVLEAMSVGTPVLASPVGGIPYVLTDGVEGMLLRGTSPEDIAASAAKLLRGSSLPKMSVAAFEKICRDYSLDATAEVFKKSKNI